MLPTRQHMPRLHGTRACRFCKAENINETRKHSMEECPEIKQKLGKHIKYAEIYCTIFSGIRFLQK